MTLNGGVTVTRGASASVEPVTATLPVAPGRVHSGAPVPSGAAVGQLLPAVAGSAGFGVDASLMGGALNDAGDVLAVGLFVPELQAESVTTADAAHSDSATREYIPKLFTPSRYIPPRAIRAISPRCRGFGAHLGTRCPGAAIAASDYSAPDRDERRAWTTWFDCERHEARW